MSVPHRSGPVPAEGSAHLADGAVDQGASLLSELRRIAPQLDQNEELDRVADPLHEAVSKALPAGPVKDALQGKWLGHALHPMLTDLPIGFWTGAFVLDLVGGRRSQKAADLMVAAGVATALPTAAAGLADWSELSRSKRRSGLVHAVANLTATGLYTLSLMGRMKGRRARGVAMGLLGATAATAGGYLGGHLAFGTHEPDQEATSDGHLAAGARDLGPATPSGLNPVGARR